MMQSQQEPLRERGNWDLIVPLQLQQGCGIHSELFMVCHHQHISSGEDIPRNMDSEDWPLVAQKHMLQQDIADCLDPQPFNQCLDL
jgi:hypothetical protein